MLVKNRADQTLIQVMDPEELIDPFKERIQGRQKAGEEVQPTQAFAKSQLCFRRVSHYPNVGWTLSIKPSKP